MIRKKGKFVDTIGAMPSGYAPKVHIFIQQKDQRSLFAFFRIRNQCFNRSVRHVFAGVCNAEEPEAEFD